MQGKMFVRPPKGYHVEIIGDRQGEAHKVVVPNQAPKILKAKAFKVYCQGGRDDEGNRNPEVEFKIDGPDAVSQPNAVRVACDRYRHVMDLAPQVQVNCRVEEIRAKIGATA